MMKLLKFGILLFLCLLSSVIFANNIRVSNVSVIDQNTDLDQYTVQFDLAWDNSWRISEGPSNWDAAWIFLKFTRANEPSWQHGAWFRVSDNPIADGHVYPSEAELQIPEDRVGAFIFRAQDGSGNLNLEQIQLIWDYSGEDIEDEDQIEIGIHAIEMVYVPEGAFYLGDNGGLSGTFQVAGSSGLPYLIDDEGSEIILGGFGALSLGNGQFSPPPYDDFSQISTQTLPPEWPMGYHAMYVMKYEATNAMYSSFYNTLDEGQKENMYPASGLAVTGDYIEFIYPYKPVRYTTWAQVAAFLDWSGLRPLSETEYEKACRGPELPVPNEFAWGTNGWYGTQDEYLIANEGGPDEVLIGGFSETFPNGALVGPFNNTIEALRVGIFAASVENPTRVNTGASYYGMMEMTGNGTEIVVGLGSSSTRDFTGLHGNGEVDSSGNASSNLLSDWSSLTAIGMIIRGNASNTVSFRTNTASMSSLVGFRGCRTAP